MATFAAGFDQIWTLARTHVAPAAATALEQDRSAVQGPAERIADGPPMPAVQPVRSVRVVTVEAAPQREEKTFTGVVAARYETQLGFRVAGKIASRHAEVGQQVRSGDLLMALDPADYQAALRAADANLAAARAQEAQAAAEERRQATLLRQGWTTRAAYDRVLAASKSAAEQVKAALEQVRLARNSLDYADLRAPHDGIVTALRAEAGQVVSQGQPVVTLVRPGEREALIAIPEGQIYDLASWQATVSFWSRGDRREPALLREVAPQADAASRTHPARFSMPKSQARADLGATVSVHLTREQDRLVVTVPATALFFRNDKPFVWRVAPSGDRVSARAVEIVALGAERAVLRGLDAGDRIVTLGVHRLDEMLRVKVVEDRTMIEPRR